MLSAWGVVIGIGGCKHLAGLNVSINASLAIEKLFLVCQQTKCSQPKLNEVEIASLIPCYVLRTSLKEIDFIQRTYCTPLQCSS